jgi:hypothetical protein
MGPWGEPRKGRGGRQSGEGHIEDWEHPIEREGNRSILFEYVQEDHQKPSFGLKEESFLRDDSLR